LGAYGTKASRIEYARVIAEWETGSRCLVADGKTDISVNKMILA
jgi:hypothetical protein